jgi:hypothetical protein
MHGLVTPLAICAVAWSGLHLIAWLGTLIGDPLGPAPVHNAAFVRNFGVLAQRALPELSECARLAAGGALRPPDLHLSLVFLAVAKLAAHGSAELWLMFFSLLSYAGVFVLLFVWLGRLADRAAATAGVILLAAAPWSFRLSDGDPRGFALLASIAALLLAERSQRLRAGLAAAVGVLAHPVALATLPAVWRGDGGGTNVRSAAIARWAAMILPLLALGARWMVLGRGPRGHLSAALGNFAIPSEPYLWLLAPGLGFLLASAALLLRARDWRSLSLLLLQAVLLFVCDGFSAGRELWICAAAFLPLGVALARSPFALAGTTSALMLFQSLFFYLQTHHLPLP